MSPKLFRLLIFLLSLFYTSEVASQIPKGIVMANGNNMRLRLEKNGHVRRVFHEGQLFHYKVGTSAAFESGSISAINDSSILVHQKNGDATILIKDLSTIRMRRSITRIVIGSLLTVAGFTILVTTHPNPHDASGVSQGLTPIAYVIGGVSVVGGVVLVSLPKKVDLHKSWKLRTTR